MERVQINSIEQYHQCQKKGFEPLVDVRFDMDIFLRVQLQNDLFGKKCPKHDDKFFRFVWNHRPHVCEETVTEIRFYSAVHMSHILGKDDYPQMRYDGRNINIVVFWIHQIWEFGKEKEKKKLGIWKQNQIIIPILKSDYRKLGTMKL